MIYGSLCSGIEAATQAFHPLGWTPAFFSEIEKFPSAVLAHHYPTVPNYGDMTKFQDWPDHAIDLLVGGTPCQSFSVAGLRKGLADPRGNLMLTFGAVARKYRPNWILWENVPGVLSSHGGRDFGTFLGMLAELGYGFAYRVLDAQYVRVGRFARAVPQRRRRVFVVGHLGDWRRAAAVLFERESLSGHPAPRRESGQNVAPTISARPSGGGGLGTDFDLDGGLISSTGSVAHCLNAGGMGRIDYETETMIAHALRGEGFDASEDGTGRGTPLVPVAIQERAISENPDAGPDGIGCRQDGAAYTLEARTVPQAVAFVQNTRDEVRLMGGDGSIAGALAAEPGTKQQCYVAAPVAFDCKGTEVQFTDDGSHPTLRSMGHNHSHQNAGGHAAVAFATSGYGAEIGEVASTMQASFDRISNQVYGCIPQPWAVRRLTPIECERLQGFPDDFTRIPYRGKPADRCPDGPRYKALGNSMAVNVMAWIGERIALVDAMEEGN